MNKSYQGAKVLKEQPIDPMFPDYYYYMNQIQEAIQNGKNNRRNNNTI